MTASDQDPFGLTAEAQELQARAKALHEAADRTPPGSPEHVAADEADEAADQEWQAASAVTSRVEGFTGGEALE